MSDAENPEESKSEVVAVGYGRPPASHQFKKGVSGNARGRPKKKPKLKSAGSTVSLENLILAEAYRPIQIRENGKLEELPMIQAVLRSLGVAAVKGSHRAQLAVTGLVQAVEQKNLNERHALVQSVIEYKMAWEEVFERCDRTGQPRPEPVPHPDDLVIDFQAPGVIFNGPFDDADKARWDELLGRRRAAEDDIAYYRSEMDSEPEHRGIFEDEISYEQRFIDMISASIPDEQTRRAPGFNIHEWRQGNRIWREMVARQAAK